MKSRITIQERLKDLRKEKNLYLEQLAQLTGISKSALGSYETDDYKEINHNNLVILADFYGVSVDYILCRTENREQINTPLSELHISDEMVELLKSEQINNRLLCEIATHEKFKRLMTDTEIYIDGHATARFRDINESLEEQRLALIKNHTHADGDLYSETLLAAQLEEEDFFCHVTHKTWDAILHDIHKAHENDSESAPDTSAVSGMIKMAERALRAPGNYLDVFCYTICEQLGIRYDKLPEQERSNLKKVLQKAPHYKNSPLSSRKRR